MRVSILGNGLTSLALAQMLANEGIRIDIFSNKRIIKYKRIQTLGISKTNIDFFNQNVLGGSFKITPALQGGEAGL